MNTTIRPDGSLPQMDTIDRKIDKLTENTEKIVKSIKRNDLFQRVLDIAKVVIIPIAIAIITWILNSSINDAATKFQQAATNAAINMERIDTTHTLVQSINSANPYVALHSYYLLKGLQPDDGQDRDEAINLYGINIFKIFISKIEILLGTDLTYSIPSGTIANTQIEYYLHEDIDSKSCDATIYLPLIPHAASVAEMHGNSTSIEVLNIVRAFETYGETPLGRLFVNLMYKYPLTRQFLSRYQIAIRLEKWMLDRINKGDRAAAFYGAKRGDKIHPGFNCFYEVTRLLGNGLMIDGARHQYNTDATLSTNFESFVNDLDHLGCMANPAYQELREGVSSP